MTITENKNGNTIELVISGRLDTGTAPELEAKLKQFKTKGIIVFEGNYNTWIQAMPCKAVCSASLLDTLPGCCDCINKPYCGVCPVINYAINGNLTQKSKDRCIIYKGILTSLLEYIYEGNPQIIAILNEWSEQA